VQFQEDVDITAQEIHSRMTTAEKNALPELAGLLFHTMLT